MYRKTTDKWLIDLKTLTCQNRENKIVIVFEKKGNALQGQIKEIPLSLLNMWTQDPNINKLVRKTLIEADEVFFNAYFANEIERKYRDTLELVPRFC